ncbi:MAG: hypothetical protein LC808_40430 [Actinobacteria bacterium]|nr:hypothetical protein [Actinomycetota bacterium]
MLDPVSGALEVAIKMVERSLDQARQRRESDVDRTIAYLEAARSSMQGLMSECDEILIRSGEYDQLTPAEQRELRERIDRYLRIDRLRPKLVEALQGLRDCMRFLSDHAERAVQRRSTRQDRIDSIEQLTGLFTDLVDDLDRLQAEWFQVSGFGVHELLDIWHIMKSYGENAPAVEDQERIDQLVDLALQDRVRDNWLYQARRIEEVANRLIDSFTR